VSEKKTRLVKSTVWLVIFFFAKLVKYGFQKFSVLIFVVGEFRTRGLASGTAKTE